jgi:hypothetical protein
MISYVPIDYVSYKSQKSQTQVFCLIWTSVACAVDPSVNHYRIGKLNMWTLFCNVGIRTAKYERKSCLNWTVSLQVLPRSQLIFPSKTWFFGIYLNFQRQKALKNQYLPHSKSKSYHIIFIKSCSSTSFQHQRHIPVPLNFSATI